MIATITAAILCAVTAAQQYPDIPRTLDTCVEIGTAAHALGVSPRLAIAVGWHESRWRHGLESSVGALGPMQVRPEYHCPGRTADGCDLLVTGVRVLARYIDEEGAVVPGLCRYSSGTGHERCAYASVVLAVAAGVGVGS